MAGAGNVGALGGDALHVTDDTRLDAGARDRGAGGSGRRGGRVLLALAPDERLVARVRGGSDAAFAAIHDRYQRPLLSFCRHMLGSPHEAEDAVQQTFVNAYRDLSRGGERELRLRPWLYRIARNQCVSLLRARRPTQELLDTEPSLHGLSDQVGQRSDLRALLEDLAALPSEQREALVLAELNDNSHAEVAEILGCERERVKSLVFQARSSLIKSREAREVSCGEIREQLSVLRGGSLRRAVLRRHLSGCEACRWYREEVRRQRAAMALVLPVLPSAALKAGAGAALAAGKAAAATSGSALTAGSAATAGSTAAAGTAAGGAGSASMAGGASAAGGVSAATGSVGVVAKLGASAAAVKGAAATLAVTTVAVGGAAGVTVTHHASDRPDRPRAAVAQVPNAARPGARTPDHDLGGVRTAVRTGVRGGSSITLAASGGAALPAGGPVAGAGAAATGRERGAGPPAGERAKSRPAGTTGPGGPSGATVPSRRARRRTATLERREVRRGVRRAVRRRAVQRDRAKTRAGAYSGAPAPKRPAGTRRPGGKKKPVVTGDEPLSAQVRAERRYQRLVRRELERERERAREREPRQAAQQGGGTQPEAPPGG